MNRFHYVFLLHVKCYSTYCYFYLLSEEAGITPSQEDEGQRAVGALDTGMFTKIRFCKIIENVPL